MATVVTFHAHPDDEAIATGGVMAKYADEGHRVVLVVATRGELGEVAEGVLRPDEELWQRRVAETSAAADVLGVSRVEFLGYTDSGMMGVSDNDAPGCFWRADVEEAAGRLASILEEEGADVLTHYDENGNYGHPDHIQVHRVGTRAGQLARTSKVYEATVNRDFIRGLAMQAVEAGLPMPGDLSPEAFEGLGVSGDRVTTTVDVSPYVDRKRAAMAAHASQITDTSFFLAMPRDMFAASFGQEWFILQGAPTGTEEHDLLEGL